MQCPRPKSRRRHFALAVGLVMGQFPKSWEWELIHQLFISYALYRDVLKGVKGGSWLPLDVG